MKYGADRKELENEVAALQNIHEALGSGAWKLTYNRQGEMTGCFWSDTMRKMLGSPVAFDGVFISTDEKHETNERLHKALDEAENARNELLLEHEMVSSVSRVYFSICL